MRRDCLSRLQSRLRRGKELLERRGRCLIGQGHFRAVLLVSKQFARAPSCPVPNRGKHGQNNPLTGDPAIADAQYSCHDETPPVPQRRILGVPMDRRDGLPIFVPGDPRDGSRLSSAPQAQNQQRRGTANDENGESRDAESPQLVRVHERKLPNDCGKHRQTTRTRVRAPTRHEPFPISRRPYRRRYVTKSYIH